jgi:hypothetical protein
VDEAPPEQVTFTSCIRGAAVMARPAMMDARSLVQGHPQGWLNIRMCCSAELSAALQVLHMMRTCPAVLGAGAAPGSPAR